MPRKFVFQDSDVSGLPESVFFNFFEFRDSPKACFSDFSSFGMPRKLVFQIFRASGLPESLFFKFFELRGPPTVHFHKKQLVGASRNLIFPNFYLSGCPEARFFPFFRSSLASETLFLAISNEKPQATGCFHRFSHFVHKRRIHTLFRGLPELPSPFSPPPQ